MKIESNKVEPTPLTFAETIHGEVYRMRFKDSPSFVANHGGYIVLVHREAEGGTGALGHFVIDLRDGFVWTKLSNALFYPVQATLRISE